MQQEFKTIIETDTKVHYFKVENILTTLWFNHSIMYLNIKRIQRNYTFPNFYRFLRIFTVLKSYYTVSNSENALLSSEKSHFSN